MAKRTDTDDDAEDITPRVDPFEVLARLATAMEALAKNQQGQSTPNQQMVDMMATLSSAMSRVADSQMQGAQLMASETRRAHRPSNEVTHGISVFNRRGNLLNDYKKPLLKCPMLLPWLAEWESLTREEVELLNLLQTGTYALSRIDKTRVKVNVLVEYGVDEVTPSRLIMNHDTAFNNDNFKLMPPLVDLLRNILAQHDVETAKRAAVVISDEEEEALIAVGELSVSV